MIEGVKIKKLKIHRDIPDVRKTKMNYPVPRDGVSLPAAGRPSGEFFRRLTSTPQGTESIVATEIKYDFKV